MEALAALLAGRASAASTTAFASGSPGGFGFRRYFNHGKSQSKLATPNTIKESLQPMRAISSPPRSVPTAGPEAWPAQTNELARPRCDSAKRREMILLYEGY